MFVGICNVKLILHDTHSLKDKRHIIKSLMERIRARYNASIAETDLNDYWGSAVISFACVSNEKAAANSQVNNILNFIEGDYRVEVSDVNIEIL